MLEGDYALSANCQADEIPAAQSVVETGWEWQGEQGRKAVKTWQQRCGAEGCRGLLEAVFSVRTFYFRNTALWEAPGPGSHISLHSNPDFTSDLPRPHLLDLLKLGKINSPWGGYINLKLN